MAQFDVYWLGEELIVDCQSDLLSELNSRVVVPLIPSLRAPKRAGRFNPVFTIDGDDLVMTTQFIGAVDRGQLGKAVASLADHSYEITGAIDVLTGGV